MISTAVFISACVALFLVPLIFVAHEVYEDGLIGRGGLLLISFSAGSSMGELTLGDGFTVHPLMALMAAGFATFLCWHLFRFHRRVLRNRAAVQ